jgi:cytochrome c553
MHYSEAYLRDWFQVADWHPESHPAMPAAVARGRRPAVFACAYCHLANGAGRPENATLAGLPAKYIEQQVADMRSGARSTPWHTPNKPQDMMRRVADSASVAEVREAARYFAKLPFRRPGRVVEAERIPRVKPGRGVYFLVPGGGDEPLDGRLVEVAGDQERHELHDPNVEYVAYVPPGSIARGKTLATQGIPGVMQSCTTCHGPRLRGVAPAPPIAGRSPSYLLRQLLGFATGARATPAGEPMRAVAAALTLEDMIAAVAYAGSLAP